MLSIIIPSWNNLPYLKLCIESIEKHASIPYEILVHLNEGTDGSAEWLQARSIEFTRSEDNIGICKGVNLAAARSNMPYIVYMNDDMYVCPGWDRELAAEIRRQERSVFMLSATMIEPKETGNNCVLVRDYGREVHTFREKELLSQLPDLSKVDWCGATWPPVLVSRTCWDMVGGFSLEFSPGMSSDDDFSMKMWMIGCRVFKGVGKSLVYHFQTKSTRRVVKNDGRRQFLMKWGLKQSSFNRYYLRRGQHFPNREPEPPGASRVRKEKIKARLKLFLQA